MAEQTPLYEEVGRGGAVFAEDAGWLTPAHFGDPGAGYERARGGAVVFHVSHRGKVEVAGPGAEAVLRAVLPEGVPAPEPLRHTTAGAGGRWQVRRHEPLGVPGYDLVCPREEAAGLWRSLLGAGAAPAGLQTYHTLR